MELVTSAILIGFILSLILVGPVFFLLIETSISRGWRAAIALDLGVITADILCILIAYYGSKDLATYIQTKPSVFIVGGFFILIYGLMMFKTKPNLKMRNVNIVNHNYFKTFLNGLMLNLLNVGVIVFWFFIVSSIVIQYPKEKDFFIYMAIVLATFFSLDLLKILLAQKVKSKFTIRRVFYFRKTIGLILVLFGLIVILKGFGVFSEIDQRIEKELPI